MKIDEFGNICAWRSGSHSGHAAIRRSETAASRAQRAKRIRRDRRDRVLLTREWRCR